MLKNKRLLARTVSVLGGIFCGDPTFGDRLLCIYQR